MLLRWYFTNVVISQLLKKPEKGEEPTTEKPKERGEEIDTGGGRPVEGSLEESQETWACFCCYDRVSSQSWWRRPCQYEYACFTLFLESQTFQGVRVHISLHFPSAWQELSELASSAVSSLSSDQGISSCLLLCFSLHVLLLLLSHLLDSCCCMSGLQDLSSQSFFLFCFLFLFFSVFVISCPSLF